MKKLLGIVIVSLLVYQSNLSAAAPFNAVLWVNEEFITSKDPTTFQKLIYEGKQKVRMLENISKKYGGKNVRDKKLNAYVFTAYYEDNSPIIIQATSKFKSKENAEKLALVYGKMIGQLPTFLKKGIKTIHLHNRGNNWFAESSTGIIVIHAGSVIRGDQLEFNEEIFIA